MDKIRDLACNICGGEGICPDTIKEQKNCEKLNKFMTALRSEIREMVGKDKVIEKETKCPYCGRNNIDVAYRISTAKKFYSCFGCGKGWAFKKLSAEDIGYNLRGSEIRDRIEKI